MIRWGKYIDVLPVYDIPVSTYKGQFAPNVVIDAETTF